MNKKLLNRVVILTIRDGFYGRIMKESLKGVVII